MKPNIKKLLILNAPYLLFVYLFDKVGQAVRLSPGAGLSGKLLSIGSGFSAAFSNALPSFAPMDLLIGIVGAVVIRLAVYVKGKNAKKYRKGMEYGSARWGNAEDIKPYIDPMFENNVLLTQTERLMMSSRPKHPKYARNKNVLVIGGSGSGKTRFFVKPNLMQMHSSYVVTDPKGTVLIECGKLLQRGGYKIKVLNTINFKKSMRYNPFAYLRSEKDILKLVNTIIANTKGDGEKSGEDFWVKSERLFYCALIGYIWYEAPENEKNFTTLLEMINASEAREDDPEFQSPVDLIPYLQMYPDGICRVTEKKYSKSLVFEDINYQLAQADDKTAIFENWCDFLNYFDASVSVQLSFINQGARKEKAQAAIEIPAQDDAFNSIRKEYADMLKNQLEKGNNGLEKCKYITFSIEADNLAAAKARLSRIETDVLNNFKVLGVTARPMNGQERLNVLHGIFHPEGEPFRFSWDWLVPSGLSTKDFIAPSSFRFGDGRTFRMGRKLGAVSFLEILAPELNDRMLSDILDLENGIIVNLHIRSIDQSEAIKTKIAVLLRNISKAAPMRKRARWPTYRLPRPFFFLRSFIRALLLFPVQADVPLSKYCRYSS